jgi:hypothetical protein
MRFSESYIPTASLADRELSPQVGVLEDCINLLTYVRLCRRSQVDMRKRFVGKPT